MQHPGREAATDSPKNVDCATEKRDRGRGTAGREKVEQKAVNETWVFGV